MTNDDLSDPILRGLCQLPMLTPNDQRAERLRARCHAQLARRAPEKTRGFGPIALAGFCALYLAAVVHDVLRLRNIF